MNPIPLPLRRGFYFEEFQPGQTLTTPARTITEADVTAFAALTGDWNAIHTDAVYAAGGPFGQRIAHGLLVQSIAVGLLARTGMVEGTILAFREIIDWKFSLPTYLGDTVRARIRITATKAVPRLGGGMVTLSVEILNQRDETVQRGDWSALVMSAPPEEK